MGCEGGWNGCFAPHPRVVGPLGQAGGPSDEKELSALQRTRRRKTKTGARWPPSIGHLAPKHLQRDGRRATKAIGGLRGGPVCLHARAAWAAVRGAPNQSAQCVRAEAWPSVAAAGGPGLRRPYRPAPTRGYRPGAQDAPAQTCCFKLARAGFSAWAPDLPGRRPGIATARRTPLAESSTIFLSWSKTIAGAAARETAGPRTGRIGAWTAAAVARNAAAAHPSILACIVEISDGYRLGAPVVSVSLLSRRGAMANPRDAKVPTALGHTLGYGSIPGWPAGGGGGGGAELHIGRASIKQPSKSVNPRDPATMQAIVDARWALTLRERVNPVRELTLFERRKNSAAAAELAELARQSYGQRSAALYPRPAAALPRSASAAAVRTREPEPRNTLTGQGMQLNEGFDIRDGKGGGRNGTAYNHALWREGCGLEGSGRRVALVKPAPYSWRNYATDGSSELGVEVRALVERPAALHRANIARAAAAAAPPAAVSLPSSQPRGSSDLSGLKPRHGEAIARSAYPGDRNTFVAPRPSTPHVAQFRHSTQARDGMSRPPISSAEIPSGAAIQSDSGPQSSHPPAAGLAPARRGLGSSVSSPGYLGWSAPKMGGSGGGGGGEGGGGNGGGGAGGGAALTVGCGSVVGTVSAQQRHENLGESAAPLGRDAAPASVVMLSETGARLGS